MELTGSPAVADGRIYFLTSEELICIGKKGRKQAGTSVTIQARIDSYTGGKPAHLQVVPADVALTPGQSVTFKALAYDDHGVLLGEVKADWSLAGPLPPAFPIGMAAPPPPKTSQPAPRPMAGKLSDDSATSTKLTVGGMPPSQFGRVVAKMGSLTAYARVRVAPILPYSPDFTRIPQGRTPGGWINCQGKYSIGTMKDGTIALKKRNDAPSPLVAQAHAYIGLPTMTGYTIQADMQGNKLKDEMPDMGVGANRYDLVLIGNTQQLR